MPNALLLVPPFLCFAFVGLSVLRDRASFRREEQEKRAALIRRREELKAERERSIAGKQRRSHLDRELVENTNAFLRSGLESTR
jgi:hypothetical protein